jgi:hypothetical protein
LSSVTLGWSAAQGFGRLDVKAALFSLLFAPRNAFIRFGIQLSRNGRRATLR